VEKIVSRLLKFTLVVLACSVPALGWAEETPGKIAVVDLNEAIMQTDFAQKRMAEVRDQDDYKADKAEYDRLQAEFEELVKKLQKDAAVMSQDQQIAARKKLTSKQADLEHVTGKLRQAEQAAGQALFQEMGQKVQEVLREIIADEGIGLLLQRNAVIHADASYSVSSKVTDKLNQAATK
jgi:outer membrane protein